MPQPLRIAVNGATGRMGTALCALVAADPGYSLVHAVASPASARLGEVGFADGPRLCAGWDDAPVADAVVDFSTPAALGSALAYCLRTGTPLVTGTTGVDAALGARLDAAAARIPVLRAANFGLGVAVLARLAREAASALPDWDAEIVELHHRGKRDAPSGTALALGRAVADARAAPGSAPLVIGRAALEGPREIGSIGFASVRGGDAAGEHSVFLLGTGERLELVHRATDRTVFARGALLAARWIAGRGRGAYTLDDVLFAPAAGGRSA